VEIAESRPRPVRLTAAGWVAAVFMLSSFVAAFPLGAWLFLRSQQETMERSQIESSAIRTEAEVIRLTRTGSDNPRYTAEYRFAAGNGNYTGKARISRAEWQRLKEGSTMSILYLPSDPSRSWSRSRLPRPLPVWVGPLAGLGLAAAAFAPLVPLRRQWLLLAEGRHVHARVSKLEKQQTSHVVRYEFRVLSGAMRTGRYGPVDKPPNVGDTISVLYDPEDPARNRPLPLELVKWNAHRS
jgi:hypothetical protein